MEDKKEVWRCILVKDGASRLPNHRFSRVTHIRHIEGSNLSWWCYNKEPFETRMERIQKRAEDYWESVYNNLPWYKKYKKLLW